MDSLDNDLGAIVLSLQPYAYKTDNAEKLTKQTGNPTLARVLAARGVTDVSELDLALSGLLSSAKLLGITEAVAKIDEAIDGGVKILVVGDFDCDGATSTALMVRALREMGARVDFLVPDRFKFGYGLTVALVEHAKAVYDPALIITVDNGISSHDGVEIATQLGIETVITDHHLTSVASPKAMAVVNPNQLDCPFDSKSLVGVGVAFYVMGALAKHRRQLGKSSTQVSRYLDLVALGTIADVGFLDKNNRILVNAGLQKIRQGDCVMGILAILMQAGRNFEQLTAADFGFAIAPRINAAGRMDNMQIGVECLLTNDWHAANEYARQLDKLNQDRRQVEEVMKADAGVFLERLTLTGKTEQANARSVVLYQDDWHQGVIGIVAGRIKEAVYRPAIIFAPADVNKLGDDDLIKGSARSIAGVHIRDLILQVAETNPTLICYFGGHAAAAGLTIYKKNFEAFRYAFEQAMAAFDERVFCRQTMTDGELMPSDMSLDFAWQLKHLTIWGHGFAEPCFDGVFLVVQGKILKDKHLKLSLKMTGVDYPIDAIWFNYDKEKWDYRANWVHVLYRMDINEWQGNQRVQLIVQDLALVDRGWA